jgi:hypothetical protein
MLTPNQRPINLKFSYNIQQSNFREDVKRLPLSMSPKVICINQYFCYLSFNNFYLEGYFSAGLTTFDPWSILLLFYLKPRTIKRGNLW